MKRPVWRLELLRDTDAPLARVAERLRDGAAFGEWHPRLREVKLQVHRDEPECFEAEYCLEHPGVLECGRFRLWCEGGRTVLHHEARFKGWPVLLLMGWWRLRSHRMWERFVEAL